MTAVDDRVVRPSGGLLTVFAAGTADPPRAPSLTGIPRRQRSAVGLVLRCTGEVGSASMRVVRAASCPSEGEDG